MKNRMTFTTEITPEALCARRIALTQKLRELKPNQLKKDFTMSRELTRGWLLPYLLRADDLLWGRWDHWARTMEAGRLLETPIPEIEWTHEQALARKMLEQSLNTVCKHGEWRGWSGHQHFEYLLDWLLFGLGDPSQMEMPKEGCDQAGASDRLYQLFNLNALVAFPHDYWGDIMAESGWGKGQGFFPTPMDVCTMMVRMQMGEEDCRMKTVCDPALGTGRMLLCASNHSFRLYGMDINQIVIKACKVNLWIYSPWGAKPFPFWDQYESAHPDAPARPHLTQRVPVADERGQYSLEIV